MYSDWISLLVVGLVIVWLGFLSFLIWQQNRFLKLIFPKSGERDIRKKFEELKKTIESFRNELLDLENKVKIVETRGLEYIQRVGLLRFNPYDDTGGNISFTVCLLDHQGSGIVITSLHARSGTRVFGKEILSGKSKNQELSKEEELVIKKAMTKQ